MLGVKPGDLRNVDLSPSGIAGSVVRTYDETAATVVRYYENLRFVYEIETRVRDIREAAPAEESVPAQPEPRKDDSTSGPSERQQQNYSRGAGNSNLALQMGNPPVQASLEAWEGRKTS
jgi:hypothetical protein